MNFLERIVVKKEMVYMINWLKIHWPHVAAGSLALIGFLIPAFKAWIAAHPGTDLATFLTLVIGAYNMTAPKDVNRLKCIALFCMAALALSLPLHAQTPVPVQTYSLQLSPISLPNGQQTVAGTAAGMALSVTPNNAFGLYSIQAPGQNFQYYAGRYNRLFPSLSNKLNNLGAVNFLKFQFGLTVSTGIDRITSTGAQHYAYSGGGFVDYSLDQGGHYSLGVELQYARFPGMNNNTFTVALDPAVHF